MDQAKESSVEEKNLLKKTKASKEYLMENKDETIRLDVKTDPESLRKQALWCGVKPGMKILDGGCGPGKTTSILHQMIQPSGTIIGIDFSPERIHYAKKNYEKKNEIEFHVKDLRESLNDLGQFDLIWIRFVLEYYREGSFDIVKNLKKSIKPGGTLCLLDLDFNCLIHYELPQQLEKTLHSIMNYAEKKYNFDPFMGRKLYSLLYDAEFENIEIELMPHNLIYDEISQKDKFNLSIKIDMAAKRAENIIASYHGGHRNFIRDLNEYLISKRRFTYTPLLICKGRKSLSAK